MGLIAAAAAISAGVGLAKGVYGAVQSARANKGINRLLDNPVEYERPDEYGQILQSALQRSEQGEPAWMSQARDDMRGASATARGAAERGAISSNTYGKAVGDIYSKQLQAYQDMGMQAQQWQDKQFANLQNVRQMGAGYSDTEWAENKLRPWETQMNMYQSERQASATNTWSGIESMAGGFMDYAGTKYAKDNSSGTYS